MHINIPHKTSKSEAKKKVIQALEGGRAQFGDKMEIHEEKWEGDTLTFDVTVEGQHISGTLTVEDSDYSVDAKLPLMLRFFEGRIEKEIAEQVKKLG